MHWRPHSRGAARSTQSLERKRDTCMSAAEEELAICCPNLNDSRTSALQSSALLTTTLPAPARGTRSGLTNNLLHTAILADPQSTPYYRRSSQEALQGIYIASGLAANLIHYGIQPIQGSQRQTCRLYSTSVVECPSWKCGSCPPMGAWPSVTQHWQGAPAGRGSQIQSG